MDLWIIFWAILIFFSFTSFIYMSVKILYKGIDELKFILSSMKSDREEK